MTIATGYVLHQTFDHVWDIISNDREDLEKTFAIEIINRVLAEKLNNYAQENELSIAWTERHMVRQMAFQRLAKTIGLEALIKCWLESSDCNRDRLLDVLDAANNVRRIEDQGL